jgi:hypothetical protein|tara:strand:- start:107 stop:313 length:207 start_codon:yes stop_codon:yes gene_type:complete
MGDLIKALQILLKYGNPKWPTWCGHDCLHICDIDDEKVSDEDKAELEKLGFIVDESEGGFMSFRFGST